MMADPIATQCTKSEAFQTSASGFLPLLLVSGNNERNSGPESIGNPRKRPFTEVEHLVDHATITENLKPNVPKRPKSSACLRPTKHALVHDDRDYRPTTSSGTVARGVRKISRHSKFREVSLHDRPNRPLPDAFLPRQERLQSGHDEDGKHKSKTISRLGKSIATKLNPASVWHAMRKSNKPAAGGPEIDVGTEKSGGDDLFSSFNSPSCAALDVPQSTNIPPALRFSKSAYNLGRRPPPRESVTEQDLPHIDSVNLLQSPSRKCHAKVMRLNKRVSDLESKLWAAKQELARSLEPAISTNLLPPSIPPKFLSESKIHLQTTEVNGSVAPYALLANDQPPAQTTLPIRSYAPSSAPRSRDMSPRAADARPEPIHKKIPLSSSGTIDHREVDAIDAKAEVKSHASSTPSRNETLTHGAASGLGLSSQATPTNKFNNLSPPPPLISSIRKQSLSLEDGDDKENQSTEALSAKRAASLASIDDDSLRLHKDLEQEARSVEKQLFKTGLPSSFRLATANDDFNWDDDVF